MIIIKIWWSVFAPKMSNKFNVDLLKHIFSIISQNCSKQVILIHGTWNFWHDFVNKYWISKETFTKYKEKRSLFYKKIDEIFSWFNRISAEDILKKWDQICDKDKKYIIWWDIDSKSLKIISSDFVFWILSKNKHKYKKIMLTDVPWVLDQNNNIIKNLNISSINKIKFWSKKWDVTNWMQWKLLSLNESVDKNEDWIWIIDGKDLDNFKKLVKTWRAKWTCIKK